MGKIKIIHVVTSLGVGGMENGIVNLCNGHNREVFKPIVCCLKSVGPMTCRLREDVKVQCLDMPEGRAILFPLTLRYIFMQEKPHIVHTHGLAGGGYHGIVGACLARVPIIVNGEHGSFFNKPHQIVLQRFLARLCDANLSVSGSLKTKITEILGVPADKITVIRNGVDTNKFYRHSPRDEICQRLHHEGFAIDDTTFNIFSIGSLKKEKAQLMLLRALKDVYISDPSVKIRVIFVGDGSDRTTLTGYAKEAGLEKAVIFLGNRSDVHELLNIADVLVSTSIAKHEGLSNVMLEAMSTNVPVIATRSVGAVEVIVDGINGFLIEPGDVRALVDRLMLVYNNTSLRDEMGVQARRIILEEYTITKMVQGYEQLYLDLVSRKTH